MSKEQIKQEFRDDFEKWIDFNDTWLSNTEKKKFHEIYEKWDGKIHVDALSDNQVLSIAKNYNIPIALKWVWKVAIVVWELKSNSEFLEAVEDREKIYKTVWLEHLSNNCSYVTLCAEQWMDAYNFTEWTHKEKVTSAITVVRNILQDMDANGDEVAMMQLYLKRHFGDEVVWKNAKESEWIDGVIGEDFLTTAVKYTDEEFDQQHDGVSDNLLISGQLESKEQKEFKEYKQWVYACLNMYAEYYKNLVDNIIWIDWFDEKNITDFRKHFSVIESWLTLLQYDETIDSKWKINQIVSSIVSDPILNYSRIQRKLFERQEQVNWLDMGVSTIEWNQVIAVTDLYSNLKNILKDESLDTTQRREETSILIREIDKNDYNTNSAFKRFYTLWIHSFESTDAVWNNLLDDVHEEVQDHGSKEAKEVTKKAKEMLDTPEMMQQILVWSKTAKRANDADVNSKMSQYFSKHIGVWYRKSLHGKAYLDRQLSISKILWYVIQQKKPEQQKKIKESIEKDKEKTIAWLEALEKKWKLSMEWKQQLDHLRLVVSDDEAMQKYMDTMMMTSIGLIIEHCVNSFALEYDEELLGKAKSKSLDTYADIHGAWRDLSDQTLAGIHQTSRMIITSLVTWWASMVVAWAVSRAFMYAIQVWLKVKKIWKIWMIALNIGSTLVWWAAYNVVEQWLNNIWDREKFMEGMEPKNFVSRTVMLAVMRYASPVFQQVMQKVVWKSTWFRVIGWKVLVEETVVAVLADYWVDQILWDWVYTKEEFIQWLIMGLVFDLWGYKLSKWKDLYDLSGLNLKERSYTKEELNAVLKDPEIHWKIEAWATESLTDVNSINHWVSEAISGWKEWILKKFWSFINNEKAWMQEMLWNIKLQVTKVKNDIMSWVILKKTDQWIEAQRNFIQCMWNLSKIWVVLWTAWVPPIAFIPWSSVLTFYITQNRKPIKKLFWFTFEAVSYFEGKVSRFWFTELQARSNSKLWWEKVDGKYEWREMVRDRLLKLAVEKKVLTSEQANEFRDKINDKVYGLLQQAHEIGELWKLTPEELEEKIALLRDAFDSMTLSFDSTELRRFGVEAGIFGRQWVWLESNNSNKNHGEGSENLDLALVNPDNYTFIKNDLVASQKSALRNSLDVTTKKKLEWLIKKKNAFLLSFEKSRKGLRSSNPKMEELMKEYDEFFSNLLVEQQKLSWLPLDFDNPILGWWYAKVYRLNSNPSTLVKIGNIPPFETLVDLEYMVKVWKKLNNPRIWLPFKVVDLWWWKYAQFMHDVSAWSLPDSLPNLSQEAAALQLCKDISQLRAEWIHIDLMWHKNVFWTPKWYSIIDMNMIPTNKKKLERYHGLMFWEANRSDLSVEEIVKKITWFDVWILVPSKKPKKSNKISQKEYL